MEGGLAKKQAVSREDPLTRWSGIERVLDDYLTENRPPTEALSIELSNVVVCIHECLFEPELTVKVIRSRCRIRDNNVSSRFRYAMGRGIKDYIEQHRMAVAVRLLCRRDLTVFDVAMAVGYNHVETFYQAFKRRYGSTPGQFRKM